MSRWLLSSGTLDLLLLRDDIADMTTVRSKPIFPSTRVWNREADRRALPIDVPGGPRKGEVANLLVTRHRNGETIVEITWKVEGQVNLSSHIFRYDSPRAALDDGWELGPRYEEDALAMEREMLRRAQEQN